MTKNSLRKAAAAILTVAALFFGSRLKRTVTEALGGSYSLLSEFHSDISAALMHKFDKFRNFTLIAVFVCLLLLWLLLKFCRKPSYCAVGIIAFYAVCCMVYFLYFLAAPAAIAPFATLRALYSSFFIVAVILLYDKPLP